MPLAGIGACNILSCAGDRSDFDIWVSPVFVAAFVPGHELTGSDELTTLTLRSGPWTVDSLRERLASIDFADVDGRREPLWSRVVVFDPYSRSSDFLKAGITVPSTAALLEGLAMHDAGVHLVAFDRWQPNLIVAHLFISTTGDWPPVLVIDSDEVPRR